MSRFRGGATLFRPATRPPSMATLTVVTGLSVLSLNLFLPSLTSMSHDMDVGYSTIALSISGFLAITAILQLVMGPLSDRYGRRPLLLIGLAIFTIASVGCAVAQSFEIFMFWRILQGAVIAGSALTRAVVRDTAAPNEAAAMLGTIGMVMALAPMLGPFLGGGLEATLGWRASFWAFAVFGAVTTWMIWSDLGETNLTPSATFTEQFRTYPALLGSGLFWAYAVCIMLSTGVFFTFLGGAPFVAEYNFGMSPPLLGLAIGTTPVGFMIGNFITRRIAARVALTRMMIWGRAITVLGLAASMAVLLAYGPVAEIYFGMMVFVGLGNGISMPSATVGAMSVRPDLAGSASGLSGAMMVGGGAALTALGGWIMTPKTGAFALLALLLVVSVGALAAALIARWLTPLEIDPVQP